MKLKIWTEAYNPFIMGGDVNRPISTEVEVSDPVELGRGVKVYEIASPQGTTHIAEAKCGALVGTSLEQVRRDFDSAAIRVVNQQIASGKKRSEEAVLLSNEEFWRKFK